MDDTAELVDTIVDAMFDKELTERCGCRECVEEWAVIAAGQIQSKFRISRIGDESETYDVPPHPMDCNCGVCEQIREDMK